MDGNGVAICNKTGEGRTYYEDHFSEISLSNARGGDGRIYGVPKDKDTVCLVYNKEMFDAAQVEYPDGSWTWDDLTEASQAIFDKTGKYGYMAYADDQLGYWNFVYQAGGRILSEDKERAEFLSEGRGIGGEGNDGDFISRGGAGVHHPHGLQHLSDDG